MALTGEQVDSSPQFAGGQVVRGSNQSGLRAHNERLVLTLIRQMGPLAKSEIAKLSGLSAQTVSVIMRSLEADGFLEKGVPHRVRGKVGQPSTPMNLAAEGAYFLGLKVGRRSLDLLMIDFCGTVMGRVHKPHRYPTPDNVVAFASQAAGQLISRLPASHRDKVAGLGIAMPFRIWSWTDALGLDAGALEDWRHRDIAEEIARTLAFPVYLQNDATAACAAELVFGTQDRPSDFLYFFIGFFVGGGLVLDHALVTGRTGNAAAIGPMPVVSAKGDVLRLLDVASLVTLETDLRKAGLTGDEIWVDGDSWSVPNDSLESWMSLALDGLTQAIYASCCVVDVGHVMLDGWLPASVRADMVARLNARLEAIDWVGIDRPRVLEGSLGNGARSLGAASLPLSERFMIDRNAFMKG